MVKETKRAAYLSVRYAACSGPGKQQTPFARLWQSAAREDFQRRRCVFAHLLFLQLLIAVTMRWYAKTLHCMSKHFSTSEPHKSAVFPTRRPASGACWSTRSR